MNSPEYIQTSLAAAISLGLESGSFKNNIKLTGLNLLLIYDEGCLGKCAYCGLSKIQDPVIAPLSGIETDANADIYTKNSKKNKTFIRVKWPVYKLDEIIKRTKTAQNSFHRICISMVTRTKAIEDTIFITRKIKEEINLPISLLISPSVINNISIIRDFRAAGADMIGVAIDAATEEIFNKYRGTGVRGPHSWEKYWEVLEWSAGVFGKFKAGVHLICGLGETEKEMTETIYRAHLMGAKTHLFSFYPEASSLLEEHPRPDLLSYRKIQIAAYLINRKNLLLDKIRFDSKESIIGFNYDLTEIIEEGYAFMTSGCPGDDEKIAACNRPLANERPSETFRNYPYVPSGEDKEVIREQIKSLI